MIRINLIPAEEVQRSVGKRQQMAVGVLVVGAAAGLLVLAHGWQQVALMSAGRSQTRLERQLAELKGPYEAVIKMEREKKQLEEKLAVIGHLEAKKVGPVRVLSDLSDATPDKLWLTEFVETAGQVRLIGLGVDEQTVADFLRRLAASPYFEGVDLEETIQVISEGTKHKRFVIRSGINYAATPAPQKTTRAPGQGTRVALAQRESGR